MIDDVETCEKGWIISPASEFQYEQRLTQFDGFWDLHGLCRWPRIYVDTNACPEPISADGWQSCMDTLCWNAGLDTWISLHPGGAQWAQRVHDLDCAKPLLCCCCFYDPSSDPEDGGAWPAVICGH
ncbi:MAG: hypothetical protein VKN13_07540 [Cyanobacteriota bacterium]|nr:hypothetical protein [Cyanobacteriota bacterium]